MGKGKTRAVEKGVIGQQNASSVIAESSNGSLNIPSGPIYYPNEEEFRDPLSYIYKIRPEAEQYGICKIVPPNGWKAPFALDLDVFTFPTKTQAIHQLQARAAPCDPKTFDLEYYRFLEEYRGKKIKKRVVFEGEDLDLCKLFNAVKRFGGYDKVLKEKKWGEVLRFVRSGGKTTECAKHVLCQLYREHLFDYEEYYNKLNKAKKKSPKRGAQREKKGVVVYEPPNCKRRRKNTESEKDEIYKVEEEEYDQICEQCQSGLHGEVMLLCDRCNKGWHIYCLSPPLKRVPPGNWYCLDCLNSEKDSFGFVPGKEFSLEAFRRIADRTKKKWFGSAPMSRMQLEKKFWDIVEGLVGEVEVMYGSDLDTSVHGSGFPRVCDSRPPSIESSTWEEYCASPWNLNNLPKLQGSVLRAVYQNITGVMVPWLYIGMLFSSFCWHIEDHCFYSMNYHHWGEPKCWYSVPGSQADAFEKVMHNSLPDLFDAQPDLLFQLVTMLNPRVLQENNVPVYSVLQEPGNIIITFPRSYHAGFNFGLNCAEAVNFAPADWLPHGGFGANLYKVYHKTPVLSHEELLCVIAKNDFDSEVSPYLRKELIRVYSKEKTWRERLWRNGVVNFSRMPPRKQPDFVGTEEDPTCIICQQILYLSAVACHCRTSAFVCVEHWEHLCECKPNKHTLLYRYTLAELSDLVCISDKVNMEEVGGGLQKQELSSGESAALSRKVKGIYKTHLQLAEEWLVRASTILQTPYSRDVYDDTLNAAKQFLWAGPEMDLVRDMANRLVDAQDWAEAVRDCLLKVDTWLSHKHNVRKESMGHLEKKVTLEFVNKLLDMKSVPCNESCHLRLKEFWQESRKLIQEIESTLANCPEVTVADLETLFSRTIDLPIHFKESERLDHILSSAKAWADSVRRCTSEGSPASVEPNFLCRLEEELKSLEVQLPEIEMFSDIVKQVEFCQSRCNQILKGSITLEEVERLLVEFDGFTVNVAELNLLRQYYSETTSWISRVSKVLLNVSEREDQENVLDELTSIQRNGLLLKIEVEELPHIDTELRRASCRVKAQQTLCCKMSMEYASKLMQDAKILQIDGEKLFADISGIYAAAVFWEERAKQLLSCKAELFEFEDILRSSEDICIILPSLGEIEKAVSMASTWLNKSRPFLTCGLSMSPASSSLLRVETLKELLSESKLLKVSMREQSMLEKVSKRFIELEQDACSLLHEAENLLNTEDGNFTCLISKLESHVMSMESVMEAGYSLAYDFSVIPKFQDACSTLSWCLKALSFCNEIPALEEVESSLKLAEGLPVTYVSCTLYLSLLDGINWLKNSLEISAHCHRRQTNLGDAEEVLRQAQNNWVRFPLMVAQLQNLIEIHYLWLEQACNFFRLDSQDRSWDVLLHLRELGSSDAFCCSELDMVFSEAEKLEKWKQRCQDVIRPSTRDANLLLNCLSEVKSSLDRSFDMLEKRKCVEVRASCTFCLADFEDQKLYTCFICSDCIHLQCLGPSLVADDSALYKCTYCSFVSSGRMPKSGFGHLKIRQNCPELRKLSELLSDADDLCVWIEEKTRLRQVVEKAAKCCACLSEIVDYVIAYVGEDLDPVTRNLSVALKAVDLAGVCYPNGNCRLDQALARNSWKIRAGKLLEGSQKPTIQMIQRHLKEGLALDIPLEDYFRLRLTTVRNDGILWVDKAKKVSVDGGALGLAEVFELIDVGENLLLYFEKELKLLKERSMLYCICRRPYDQRPMLACDKCDEWYHFDCMNLLTAPKIYTCPACDLQNEEYSCSPLLVTQERSSGGKFVEPQTPSPCRTELKRKSSKHKSNTNQKVMMNTDVDAMRRSTGIELLFWRNRKPFRRVARRRVELGSLSPILNVQDDKSWE